MEWIRMFFVYVLCSETTGESYTGQTYDLGVRLAQHNDPNYTRTLHTKRHKGPWQVVYTEHFATRAEAMARERALKSGKGREWLRLLLNNVKNDG